jgi:hypothetical protein
MIGYEGHFRTYLESLLVLKPKAAPAKWAMTQGKRI